jgi:hypothetical protein
MADLVRSLPGSTSINLLLALGNVVPPSLPAKDQWIFDKPTAASPDTKNGFLRLWTLRTMHGNSLRALYPLRSKKRLI